MNEPRANLAAERSLLGACMLDESAFDTIGAIVRGEDFYDRRHGEIFAAMLAVRDRGEPIDAVTLGQELRQREKLNAVGGPQYLGDLTDGYVTSAHAETHARIVADCGDARRMVAAARELIAMAGDESVSVDQLRERGAASILAASEVRSAATIEPLETHIGAAFARIEVCAGGRPIGLRTGLRELDKIIGGLSEGQFVVIAARPAMGKTALGINIADRVARTGETVLVFSCEMPGIELATRELCAEGRIDLHKLRTMQLTGEDMAALTGAAERIYRLPILVDESGDITISDVRARAAAIKRRRGLALIVVDYVQLMECDEDDESWARSVAKITKGLKRLSKRMKLPIIGLAQLNRDCEKRPNKRPQLSDLADSSGLEKDADVVVFIYRDEVYDKESEDRGVAELIVAKQRNGPIGTARVAYHGPTTTFRDLERVGDVPADTNWQDVDREEARHVG